LDLSRKTGILTVTGGQGDRRATVRFERGGVIGAELPGTTARIDRLLLRAGKVTHAQVSDAVAAQTAHPGRRIGQILVERGAVSEADVRRQLIFQIEQTIFELIRWPDGYFRFEEASMSDPHGIPVRISTESLLMEAARRIDEWEVLASKIPHMDVVPALVGELAEDTTLDLRPAEWEVLAEIDGERTVKATATHLGRSDFEVAKIVYGLISTGVVEIIEEALVPTPTVAEGSLFEALATASTALRDSNPTHALRILGELAQANPLRPEVHILLARARGAIGRWQEAASALEEVISLDPLSAHAHYHLGFAAVRNGDLGRADEAWSTCLRLPETDARMRDNVTRARDAAAALRALLDLEEVE
ncbi:MAG: DUF4388 domain-containing protein, partial [Gemmatimonadota bacterium]|nr:DUF4388 domain-containing protein [Gemmatimonadota bacterium]